MVNGILSLLDVTLVHDVAGKYCSQVLSLHAMGQPGLISHTLLSWGVFVPMNDPDEFEMKSAFSSALPETSWAFWRGRPSASQHVWVW